MSKYENIAIGTMTIGLVFLFVYLLNGPSTSDTIYFGNETNTTIYLIVHRYTDVYTAQMNLTGVRGTTPSFTCYQETANVSTACGGLATGTYQTTGTITNGDRAYDGDWTTYPDQVTTGNSSTLYVNYTVPFLANNKTKMNIVDRGGTNHTLLFNETSACWNTNLISVKHEVINNAFGFDSSYFYCWTGAAWIFVFGEELSWSIKEEAITWNIDNGS